MASLIKLGEVKKTSGYSTSTIYRKMAAGEFPRPIKLSPNGRAVAWIKEEVDAWIEKRIEASRAGGAQ